MNDSQARRWPSLAGVTIPPPPGERVGVRGRIAPDGGCPHPASGFAFSHPLPRCGRGYKSAEAALKDAAAIIGAVAQMEEFRRGVIGGKRHDPAALRDQRHLAVV